MDSKTMTINPTMNLKTLTVIDEPEVKPESGPRSALSKRGRQLHAGGVLVDKWKPILDDSYDPEENPDGIVNLGTSENYLMLDELEKFATYYISFEAQDFSYDKGPWGSFDLRKAIAAHMTRHFRPLHPFDPGSFVFANGVSALINMLGFSLFDEGDAVLLSRPIYQAFQADFGTKAMVNCHFVSFGETDQFSSAAVQDYERAIQKSQRDGVPIKALLLCNPHNPLGRCYTRDALIAYMQLCNKYKIHLLMDEIYALSVFDVPDSKATKFHSISTFDTDQYIHADYVHLMYGMSKDTAAGGIRSGCLYTRNADLRQAMEAMSIFHWAGNLSEKVAIAMLEDTKWMDDFLDLSRERLSHRNILVRKMLEEEGIKYAPGANAGFFLWLDLRDYLPEVEDSKDSEGWDREEALTNWLLQNKVYLTNGKSLSAEEPGWYRLIFSQKEKVVKEGVRRMAQALKCYEM